MGVTIKRSNQLSWSSNSAQLRQKISKCKCDKLADHDRNTSGWCGTEIVGRLLKLNGEERPLLGGEI